MMLVIVFAVFVVIGVVVAVVIVVVVVVVVRVVVIDTRCCALRFAHVDVARVVVVVVFLDSP